MMTIRSQAILLAVGLAASGIALSGQGPSITTLAVAGRSNSAPWVTTLGSDVAIVWGASSEDGKTDVFLSTSRDAGATFTKPVRVNGHAGAARLGGELPPRVALSQGVGGSDPAMAVLWTEKAKTTSIAMAWSADFGRTFDPSVALQQRDAPGDRGWPALTIDKAGAAHAIWLDHRGLASSAGASAGHKMHGQAAAHDGVAMAQKSGLYHASLDRPNGSSRAQTAAGDDLGGRLHGEQVLAHGVCYCCKTALAAAPDGTLFAAWRHVYSGNMRDIAVTVSRDGGKTFAAPVRASEDEWAINGCPDDGPAMAIDGRGTVHIVWPTVIGGAEPRGAIFYASTRDGRTFTERIEVPTLGSPKPSHPQIAVDATGQLIVAWDETVDGRRVAAARTLSVAAPDRVSFGSIVKLDADERSAYPVLAALPEGFIAVWTSGVGEGSSIRVRRLGGS